MSALITPSFVVAISGISGAGKSTLIRSVAQTLSEAAVLHFDDYHGVSKYPYDLLGWIQSGADPNEWSTPQLAHDLHSLRTGQAISLPGNDQLIEPQPFIVVEEPFGRARNEMRENLDFVAHISVPLDIALIRIIRRMLKDDAAAIKPVGASDTLFFLFRDYLDQGLRELLLHVDQEAVKDADLILDGRQTPEDMTRQLVEAVRLHYGTRPA